MEQRPTLSMPVIIHYSLCNTALSTSLLKHELKVRVPETYQDTPDKDLYQCMKSFHPFWPICCHCCLGALQNVKLRPLLFLEVPELSNLLLVSETTVEGSVIFPASKVAFYYLHLTPAMLNHMDDSQQRSKLLHSINTFVEGHGHCYVVLETTTPCEKAFCLLEEIQMQHLHSRLQMILSHSAAESATAMVDIAKLQCRPLSDKMHASFCSLLNRLLLEDTFPRALSSLGLDSFEQLLVQDGIGSLAGLATASSSNLMECALDRQTTERLVGFFAARHGH